MNLEYLIFPYWLIDAFVIIRAIYIRKTRIIPTLKEYDRDYEDYISLKKQKKQLEEYIEICKEHNLPSTHWKYMKKFNKISIILMIGWVALILLTASNTQI